MVVYIVSGCPRTGTSMMMQILEAANMDVARDKKRDPDKNNQHGYYEIKDIIDKLKENPEIIKDYKGKVIKIIHYGLQFLPEYDYKIIYMQRNTEEIIKSMEKMTEEKEDSDEMRELLEKFNKIAKKRIKQRKDIEPLFINYNNLIKNPEKNIGKIIEFLNIDRSNKQKMLNSIDKKQYRNRIK